jgi:hypothetical protein
MNSKLNITVDNYDKTLINIAFTIDTSIKSMINQPNNS